MSNINSSTVRKRDHCSVEGEWTAKSSGGSFEHRSWRKNAQMLLRVKVSSALTLRLSQTSSHEIGVYALKGNGHRKISFTQADIIPKSGQFSKSDYVSCTLYLPSSEVPYNIIPCTREPGCTGKYVLEVVVDNPANIEFVVCTEKWVPVALKSQWYQESAGGGMNEPTFGSNPRFLIQAQRTANIVCMVSQQPDSPQNIAIFMFPESKKMVPSLSLNDALSDAAFSNEHDILAPIARIDPGFGLVAVPCMQYRGIERRFIFTVWADIPAHELHVSQVGTGPVGGSMLLPHSASSSSSASATPPVGASPQPTRLTAPNLRLNTASSEGNLLSAANMDKKAKRLSGKVIVMRKVTIKGEWNADTAGGCANFPSYRNNPQYEIATKLPSVEIQIKLEATPAPGEDLPYVGLYVLKKSRRRITKLAKKDLVAHSQFSSGTADLKFEVKTDAPVVIIPCTYLPDTLAAFTLSLMYDKEAASSVQVQAVKSNWKLTSVQEGEWSGDSAGGRRNYGTWKNNPSFKLNVEQDNTELSIFISQLQIADEVLPVGMSVQTMEGDIVAESEFMRSLEVSLDLILNAGRYSIIPSSLDAGVEGRFGISVYSEQPVSLEGYKRKEPTRGKAAQKSAQSLEDARGRIAQEVLSTEMTYVNNLCIATTIYMESLQHWLGQYGAEKKLPIDTVKHIFSNMPAILTAHKMLLAEVEPRVANWSPYQRIGDVFYKLSSPFPNLYSVYTVNFPKQNELLLQLKTIKNFTVLLTDCQEKSGTGLFLHDFLIMPVQRIPRYVLLLKELLKNTAPTHVDYKNLTMALRKMQEIADAVNERKRAAENMEKMQEVGKLCGKPDLVVKEGRGFIREGELTHVVKGKKTKSFVYLFSDLILVCKTDKKYNLHYDLQLVSSVKDEPAGGFTICLTTGDVAFTTKNENEGLNWLVDVRSALHNLSTIATHIEIKPTPAA